MLPALLTAASIGLGVPYVLDEGMETLDRLGFDATGRRGRAAKAIENQSDIAALQALLQSGGLSRQRNIADLIEESRTFSSPMTPGGTTDEGTLLIDGIFAQHGQRLNEIAMTTGQMSMVELAQRAGIGI